jgi:hypothetical protein
VTSVHDPELSAIRGALSVHRAAEERESLTEDFAAFVRAAWPVLKPAETYHHNWHIEAICAHLELVSSGEIRRLQVWVPRASMKSMIVSVMWPAWEWTRNPGLRYWTASYELGLSGRLAGACRDLMMSRWYQERWGHLWQMKKEGERYYSNDQGGTRLATATGSTALGEHGHRILLDDLINAAAADATSKATLNACNEWYDSSVMGSRADPATTAIVLIMQRLHENDPAAHAMEQDPSDWTILCMPERYEANHPQVYAGDPRSEGDYLWPEHRPPAESEAWVRSLGSHRAAGQAQQRPAAREGEILKRYWWRFYDPSLFTDSMNEKRRPKFSYTVQSIDTPLKDKDTNDRIAIQAWGVAGGDRYLLDLRVGHLNVNQAMRAVLEQGDWLRKTFRCGHHILIENAGYGVEMIPELKRKRPGVAKLDKSHEGDKVIRAEWAASDLESGNCFLPGFRTGSDELSMPDEKRNSSDVNGFIDECAMFPAGKYDDQVDAFSQAMNWIRNRPQSRGRISSAFKVKR